MQRARAVTLDGSKSTTRRKPMRSYEWRFTPGTDCDGVTPKNVRMTGKKVTIVPLCSLTATLKVTNDEGDTGEDVARINVAPRGGAAWRTPFSRRPQDGGPGAPAGVPTGERLADGTVELGKVTTGLNASDCGKETQRGAVIVCPSHPAS